MSKNMVKLEKPQTTICWISKATCAQAHDHAQARVPTHTNTHTSTHATTCERAQTHTEIFSTRCFLRQQWFRECTSILRYTYIACLVILRFRNFIYSETTQSVRMLQMLYICTFFSLLYVII